MNNRILRLLLFIGILGALFYMKDCKAEEYKIYIQDEMVVDKQLQNNLAVLSQATKDDTISIYIDSNGGFISVAYQYLNAIKDTKGTVLVYAGNRVMSAATVVFCGAPVINKYAYSIADEKTLFLVHSIKNVNPDGGLPIKPYDVKNYPVNRDILNLIQKGCPGLLTEQDIINYNEGKDVFITGVEYRKHLGR